jgi:hypothetical protein
MNHDSLFSHPVVESDASPHSSVPVENPEFSDADVPKTR